MHFENFGSLRAPVPGLLFSLGIDFKLVQDGLDITLVLDGQKVIHEFLSEVQIIVSFSLTFCLIDYSAD